MKIKTNPFIVKHTQNMVEVWLGEPNEPESEFVLVCHAQLVPALIASLKSIG
tara:strand:+ start:230 stop:385 length:156 start_codon:yes stop_codon:yes gene_type:complete